MDINYFAPHTAAERYAIGRPYFHSNTIQKIKQFLNIDYPLDKALDIACGTGLSSKALLSIANHIYATDVSQAMLNNAIQHKSIQYALAPADKQPFANDTFDLVTVSSGVHWFTIDSFLVEANRLLKSKCYLVIYDNFFLAEMEGSNAFKTWHEQVYLLRYPAPLRNDTYEWSISKLLEINFNIVHEESFKNEVYFNKMALIRYFTSQSNIIVAVKNGATTYEEVEYWLKNELIPFFKKEEKQQLLFGNHIKYLQKTE